MASQSTGTALTATCHCGSITITIPTPPAYINECQCSICYRYGAGWAYYPREEVKISAIASSGVDKPNDQLIQSYVRTDEDGDGGISFNWCGHCGCMTHWASTGKVNYNRPVEKMGVNTRMLPKETLKGVERRITYK
jgi:hypothetical protein